VDRAGIRRFVLAGFSMGGYAALELARRAPERLAGLLLVDTRAEPDTDDARRGRAETAAKVRAAGPQVLVDSMLPKLLTPRAPPAMVEEVRAMMLRIPPEGAAQALLGMGERPDSRPSLGAIHVPTLVLVGAEDVITPPEASRAMQAAIPGAHLEVIPGAAHLAPVEQADAVNAAILSWARGLK
jgi:pimeloyl-ACP methyl ester carboxylesterase